MSKTLEQKSAGSPGRIEKVAGGMITAYVVAKALQDARAQRKADKLAKAVSVSPAQTSPAAVSAETKPRVLTPEEQSEFSQERARLAAVQTFFGQYINAPSSMRKLLPRGDVYHAPWSFHHQPSYGSLHLDQSEYNDPKEPRKYSSGLENLVALGKKPLQDVLSRSASTNSDSRWGTIISGEDITQTPAYVTDAGSAGRERDRLIGLWAAVEGMGFDSSDMAFASWDDRQEGSHYALVPYDEQNDLHHTAINGLGARTDLLDDPGLMIRFQGTRPKDISVSIRAVDISGVRSEMGDLIPPTPDPAQLAAKLYTSPGVLPSTQMGML